MEFAYSENVTVQIGGSRIHKNSEEPRITAEWAEFLRIQLRLSRATISLK